MADTTFTNGTVVQPDWLNDVNDLTYSATTTGKAVLSSADSASAQTTLNVPSRTGSNASGTWGISITGNADTATNSTQLGGVAASGYTRTTGTSELGSVARTSGNTSAGFSGGVEARNSGTGAGTGTYFNGVLHSVSVGGMEVVDLGSGAAELRFSSTPAGDPNTDRRVVAGKLRSDGIWEGVGFLPSDTGGGIGTYAFCYRITNTALSFGATVAGSDLKPTQAGNNSSGGSALTGTWRCLGQSNSSATDSDRKTLYVRIS